MTSQLVAPMIMLTQSDDCKRSRPNGQQSQQARYCNQHNNGFKDNSQQICEDFNAGVKRLLSSAGLNFMEALRDRLSPSPVSNTTRQFLASPPNNPVLWHCPCIRITLSTVDGTYRARAV